MNENLMNVSQLAKKLNISRARIYRFIKTGQIPSDCVQNDGKRTLVDIDRALPALSESLDPARVRKAEIGPSTDGEGFAFDIFGDLLQEPGAEKFLPDDFMKRDTFTRNEAERIMFCLQARAVGLDLSEITSTQEEFSKGEILDIFRTSLNESGPLHELFDSDELDEAYLQAACGTLRALALPD